MHRQRDGGFWSAGRHNAGAGLGRAQHSLRLSCNPGSFKVNFNPGAFSVRDSFSGDDDNGEQQHHALMLSLRIFPPFDSQNSRRRR